MSLITYKIIAGLLIFLTGLLAVIFPLRMRAYPHHHTSLELADAFASGIFLGAALFHMLPDATKSFQQLMGSDHYPFAEFFCAAGFLLLLLLERLSQYSANVFKWRHALPYMVVLILVVHAFIEGTALGINTTMAAASILFFAIIAHKSSESFALAVVLHQANARLGMIIILIGIFSLMTPLGIAMGTLVTERIQTQSGLWLSAGFNSFAAGTFLYMSTLHHINHHKRLHESENLLEFVCLTLGLIIMGSVALLD